MALGWFLVSTAHAEERWAQERHDVSAVKVGEVMEAPAPAVAGATSVSAMLARTTPWYRAEEIPVVDPAGELTGLLSVQRLAQVPGRDHATTLVGQLSEPIDAIPVSRPDEPMGDLLERMVVAGGRPALVLDPAGKLVGVVTMTDVDRAAERAKHRTTSH